MKATRGGPRGRRVDGCGIAVLSTLERHEAYTDGREPSPSKRLVLEWGRRLRDSRGQHIEGRVPGRGVGTGPRKAANVRKGLAGGKLVSLE